MKEKIYSVLVEEVGEFKAKAILRGAYHYFGIEKDKEAEDLLLPILERVRLSLNGENLKSSKVDGVMRRLQSMFPEVKRVQTEEEHIAIESEEDIRMAQMRAKIKAQALGFNGLDQTKIATTVAELTRNIIKYAGKGTVTLIPLLTDERALKIVAEDNGPGITNLSDVLSGTYDSKQGLGMGLLAIKRLMDSFEVETNSGVGTRIVVIKYIK
ncbi:anti-sigma regulatory factor [candidate division WOR-3 bacterium]|nr:anti-sigma regulatory factor [candidate division WOR-3 bacterium]